MHEVPEGGACLNCGAPLSGTWCAQCGQRVTATRPTVHELLHEAFHEFSHFDGKIIRTIALLLFRPGALTAEFLEGKRARSVTPIRLYLVCSLFFFGVLSLTPAAPMHMTVTKEAGTKLTQAAARINKDPAILGHAMSTAFPKVMFILMPLFALIVFAFYWRAERMYVPHFYFAVHYHAFAFVALALYEATTPLNSAPFRILRLLLFLTLFVYLAMALRRVYGGSRWMTAAKMAAIIPIYGMAIVTAMGLIALVTLRRLG